MAYWVKWHQKKQDRNHADFQLKFLVESKESECAYLLTDETLAVVPELPALPHEACVGSENRR